MVTQHPDHASAPYWHKDPFISVKEEIHECFLSFSELHASEYMWDWEGKFVDEAVAERMLSQHYDYFKDQYLGKDKFLTFRLPNPKVETEFRLGKALMGIIAAGGLAKQVDLHAPPLFEVVLPMTTTAGEMIAIQEAFREITSLRHPLLKFHENGLKHIEIIPLIEDIETITNIDQLLKTYIEEHEGIFGFKPQYMRVMIARSDPAMNSGMIPTVLSIKIALAKCKEIEKELGFEIYPILGAAALPFRGGITPYNVEEFTQEYAGIRTTTIQSAFRYDYDKTDVEKAIALLEEKLATGTPQSMTEEETVDLVDILPIFEDLYKSTVENIANTINQVAACLPKRRERVQHIGLFGYSRGVGKVKLPRAIGFTAALYSLGTPPEFIGTGRGLQRIKKDKLQVLEKFYLNIKSDLQRAGRYVNKSVLKKLSQQSQAWNNILIDIEEVENYLGVEFQPETPEEKQHQRLTSKIYEELQKGKKPQDLIVEAAVLRRSIG